MAELDFTGFDVGDSIFTAEDVSVGDRILSAIDTDGDRDFYRIILEAGMTYTIEMRSHQTEPGEFDIDAFLELYDFNNIQVAFDDDSGEGLNSRLVYTAFDTEEHYLSATSLRDFGGYEILISSDDISADDPFAPRLEHPDVDIIPSSPSDEEEFLLESGDAFAAAINAPFDEDGFFANFNTGTYIVSMVSIGPDPVETPSLSLVVPSDPNLEHDFLGQTHFSSLSAFQSLSDTFVQLFANDWDGDEGSYLLSMIEASAAETGNVDQIPVAQPFNQNLMDLPAFALGQAVTGVTNYYGDVDDFRLSLPRNTGFILSLHKFGSREPNERLSLDVETANGDNFVYSSSTSGPNLSQILWSGDNSLSNSMIVSVNHSVGSLAAPGEYVLSAVPIYDVVKGDINTNQQLFIDEEKVGTLETPTDEDWYFIRLEGGHKYDFSLTTPFFSNLSYPELAIYDELGQLIQNFSNFDHGTYETVDASFTPQFTGDYAIAVKKDATLEEHAGVGDFTLSVVGEELEVPVLSSVLNLPEVLKPAGSAPAQVTVRNDGAETPTPYLMLASAKGGLLEDPVTSGYASKQLFLGFDSNANGFLETGESSTTNFNYRQAIAPKNEAELNVSFADPLATIDWVARADDLKPSLVADTTWSKTVSNFASSVGDTLGTLSTALANNGQYLAEFGVNANSGSVALAFELEKAGDFGSIAQRNMQGSMGQGWSFIGDLALEKDGDGNVALKGGTDFNSLFSLNARDAAYYTVSASTGEALAQNGARINAPEINPSFIKNANGSFSSTNALGTLAFKNSGYELALDNGDLVKFAENGQFQSIAGNQGLLETNAEYDSNNRLVRLIGQHNNSELSFAYDDGGNLVSIQDARGQNAGMVYDAGGALQTITSNSGATSFEYDGGNLAKVVTAGGIETTYEYDGVERLSKVSVAGGLESVSFDYNEFGGFTATDASGRSTTVSLLPGGQVGASSTSLTQNSALNLSETADIKGVTLGGGENIDLEFDDLGRLLSLTDPNGDQVSYEYDAVGRQPVTFTDANGNSRLFDYDERDLLTKATWEDNTTILFDYDDDGNLINAINRTGVLTSYSYDTNNNLLSQTNSSAGPVTYEYDGFDRLIRTTSADGDTNLSYDAAGRITEVIYPDGRSLSYGYNGDGQRTSMEDQDGNLLQYAYDAAGRLVNLTKNGMSLVDYTYDGGGNLIRADKGNGTATTYDYDAANRLIEINHLDNTDTAYSFYHYTYDASGNRITQNTADGLWNYGYDAAGQLISADFTSDRADLDDKSITYEYDGAGNRVQVVEDSNPSSYSTNELNQYDERDSKTYDYDPNGNLIRETNGADITTYLYDSYDRLVSVTDPAGNVSEYEYDVFGNRSALIQDGVRTEFLVDPFGMGNVVGEYAADGSLMTSYDHGIGLVSQSDAEGDKAFFSGDAVGSVTDLTDINGNILNSYGYTPFGKELFENETIQNNFEFNGLYGVSEDAENLHYMRARMYDPDMGRFLSEDPLLLNGDVANLYRFGLNDPVQYVDPEGAAPKRSILSYTKDNEPTEEYIHPSADKPREPYSTLERVSDSVDGGLNVAGGLWLTYGPLKKFLGWRGKQMTDWGLDRMARSLADDKTNTDDFITVFTDKFGPSDEPTVPIPQRKPTFTPDDTPTSASDGDPHLRTFDGVAYDFQAAGEFHLVLGDDLDIQVRQEPLGDNVSINTATAMKIGDDVVGVYADTENHIFINGNPVSLEEGEAIAVGGGSVFRDDNLFDIDLYQLYTVMDENGNGFWVNVYAGANHLRPFISEDLKGDISGLLGNADENKLNDLAIRDGETLPQPIASDVLYGEFADSWRISQEESLFMYKEGESTETFTNKDFPGEIITLENLAPNEREAAEQIVLEAGLQPGTLAFDNAVLDVALSGDPSFAAAANQAQQQFEEEEIEVQVLEVNEAPETEDDAGETDEETAITVDVLQNDSDPEDDPLTLTGGTDENGGDVSVVDNKLVVTPALNFYGGTDVTYYVSDGQGNESEGTLNLSVLPLQDEPVAVDDHFTGNENTDITGNLLDDNGNGADFDVDGDLLEILAGIIPTAQGGTVELFSNGEFSYTPRADFAGNDSFEYVLQDDNGGEDNGLVTLLVNKSGGGETPNNFPETKKDQTKTSQGQNITFNPLFNDTDIDGDPLTITRVWKVDAGNQAIINADNTITFIPHADFTGTDYFYYRIVDGQGGYDVNAINVMVEQAEQAHVNRAPDARKDFGSTRSETPVTLDLLGNDIDPDGDILAITRVWKVDGGNEVTLSENNTITFTPGKDYIGSDYFYYSVSDGKGGVDVSSVEISVKAYDATLYTEDGFDSIVGANGANRFVFSSLDPNPNIIDQIYAFNPSRGDALDIRNLLDSVGFDADGGHVLEDFVQFSDDEVSTTLAVISDDAVEDGTSFTPIAQLNNITGLTLDGLLETGGLIV